MAVSTRGDKSICLPVNSEEQYRQLITNNPNFRAYLLQIYTTYPEIFPPGMDKGFRYHDNWLHNLLIASSMNGRKTFQNG